MSCLSRRQIVAAGTLLPLLAGCETLGLHREAPDELRVILLGQALIQYPPRPDQWPDGKRFAERFAMADACFTDLETAIRGEHPGTPTREGLFVHVAPPSVLDVLKQTHVTLLATSNNHAFDLNSSGVTDAIAEIDRRDIAHAGSGATLDAASAPVYQKTPHGTVALVAFATGAIREGGAATPTRPGVNEIRRGTDGSFDTEDEARVTAAIARASRQAELVIAYHHNHYWEKDMASVPAWQRALARRCVDAGAGIFASHGAPLLQGIETYRGRPLFYDLGSFFFQTATAAGAYGPDVWESVIAECRVSKRGDMRVSLVPVLLNAEGHGGPGDLQTRGLPAFASGADAARILGRLQNLSRPFGTDIEIDGDRGAAEFGGRGDR